LGLITYGLERTFFILRINIMYLLVIKIIC
jgi:hypothetical protein